MRVQYLLENQHKPDLGKGIILATIIRAYWQAPLVWKIAVGFVAGIVAGLVLGPQATVLEPLGDLFLRLLIFLAVPIILLTIIRGVSTIDPQRLGRMGVKVLGYYVLTTAFAVTLGLFVGWLFNLGSGSSLTFGQAEEVEIPEAPSFVDVLFNIVPESLFGALAEGVPIQVLFVGIFFAIALILLRGSSDESLRRGTETLLELVRTLTEAFFVLINIALQYAPIGVFALVAVPLGEQGIETVFPLASLVGLMIGAGIVQFLFYGVLLTLFGFSAWRFLKVARDPMATAFVSRSSSATLPVTIRAAEDAGLSQSVYGFSLPLGATINMDGVALQIGLVSIFAANLAGIELGFGQLLIIVILATLASIGTASVPGVTLIAISLVFTQVGLPLAVVGLIAAVDQPLGMINTAINVTGDLTGTAIVAKSENEFDATTEHWPGKPQTTA